VKDALIHKVQSRPDVEQDTPEIVQFQGPEYERVSLYGLFNRLAIIADRLLPAGLHFSNYREPVIRRGLGIDGTVSTLLHLEITFLRDRQGPRLRPVLLGSWDCLRCRGFFW